MTLQELIRDPLYQLNLLLWMLTPSSNANVEPVLHKAGYDVHHIEGELRLPLKLAAALKFQKLEANNTAAPDLILRGRKKTYLIIECKAALFGPGSGASQRQARTLMLQTPQVLTESLTLQPGGVVNAHLLYLTAHDANHNQLASLQALQDELTAASFPTAPIGILTLRASDNGVSIDAAALPSALQSQANNGLLAVQKLSAETDPRPLYRIAWMPGSEKNADPYNEEQFAKRVLASAAMQIARAKLYKSKTVRVQLDVVLDDATSGFYKKWKKREEAKFVRDRAAEILRIQISKVRLATRTTDGLAVQVYIPDRAQLEAIVEKLRDWSTTDYPQHIQQPLFSADNSAQSTVPTSATPAPGDDPSSD